MTSILSPLIVGALLVLPQATTQPATAKLAAVQLAGAKRYTTEGVTRLSGLTVGQPITVADVAAAAERLGATGLFKTLGYRYLTKGSQMTVIFEFEEAEWTVPVVFDNFVWLADEEIVAAVGQDVPSFDMTAPRAEGVPNLISRSLQKLLETRRIPGRIEFLPQTDIRTRSLQYIFAIRDPAPKICGLRIEGAAVMSERDMVQATRSALGENYSRFSLTGFANATLRQMYRQRGYWAASFAPPVTSIVEAGCSGVDVALRVSEGAQYSVDRVQWSGNSTLTASDLDALLGLKANEIADVSTIEAGLRRVQTEYGRRGHIRSTSTYVPRLDEATRKAVFEVTLREGPQYRFGSVEFVGLADQDAADLKKKWRLQPGDLFDASYPSKFYADEIRPLTRGLGPGRKPPATEVRPDERTLTVHVRVVFK